MFIFIEMPNLYKLKEAIMWIHGAFKAEESFEELCDIRRCRDAALVGGNKFPTPESAITPPTRLSARGGCVG